jgi:hypothetical protein
MAITKEAVLLMDLKSIFAAVKDPATSKEMQNIIRDRQVASRISELMLEAQNREAEVDAQIARVVPPTTEELAAQAAVMAAEPAAVVAPATPVAPVVEPVVDTTLSTKEEDEAYKKVGVTIVRDAKGVPTRYIQDYQVRDEKGQAIGRPTHLEARTLPDLILKKQEAHESATRAFHRMKMQNLTFKQSKTILTPEQISEAARLALESKDPAKVTEVISEVIESQYQQREKDLKAKEWREEGRAIANEFMRRHLHDYNPCDANQKELGVYLSEHNLEFTVDNLEFALADLLEQGDKLVKVENTGTTKHAVEVANPTTPATVAASAAPAIPVVDPAAAVPTEPTQPAAPSQPVAEITVTTPAAAPNVQPAARRPGVNGSLPPGTLSAQRPGAQDPALARKEFLQSVKKMDPETMKKKLKTDPQFVKTLLSYGIRIQ